jgi:hypothetical protein
MIASARKRPVLLTIVCILGFIWIVFSFVGVFNPSLKKMGDWYPAIFGLIVACTFISYIGVWHMKRWGVQLFAIAFFVKQAALILIGDLGIVGIILSVAMLVIMICFYRRMDINL